MHAPPDGIGLFRQEIHIPLHKSIGQGLQGAGPPPAVGIVPRQQLLLQLEQPGPAIGAFKGTPVGLLQVSHLGGYLLRSKMIIEELPYRIGLRQIREGLQHLHQQPVTMHTGVPVETPEKERMQGFRRQHLLRTVHHMRELVGILGLRTTQGQMHKSGGCRRCESGKRNGFFFFSGRLPRAGALLTRNNDQGKGEKQEKDFFHDDNDCMKVKSRQYIEKKQAAP